MPSASMNDYGLRLWLRELPAEEAEYVGGFLAGAPGAAESGEEEAAIRARLRAFGERSFQRFRVSRRHAALVTRRLSRLEPASAARLLRAARPLIEGRSPPGEGFEALFAAGPGGLAEGELASLRELLWELFLRETDLRLQLLYRAWLARRRPERGAEVAALEAGSRPWVDCFLGGLDPARLMRWLGEGEVASVSRFLARLQNLAFPLKRVNLRFTYHCNLSCAHCYNDSGPRRKAERLDDATLLGLIRQLPAAGIEGVNLTGGEPLLYLDSLLAMVREARTQGLREISILTNGFWGETPERALAVFDRLAEAGFSPQRGDWIKISCGIYHQAEGITLEGVAGLARSYRRRFSQPLILDFELPHRDARSDAELRAALHGVGLSEGDVRLKTREVAALGRGTALAGLARESFPAGHFGPCRELTQLAIDPDGSCRPCCGLNEGNAGLVIGSIHDDSLREIVKRMQNHPLLQAMAREPLGRLLERLPLAAERDGFSSNCELCGFVLGGQTPEAVAAACEPLRDRASYYPHWLV